jgi:hypothetical protein
LNSVQTSLYQHFVRSVPVAEQPQILVRAD